MALQNQCTLSVLMQGDGVATTFTFSPNKMMELFLDAGVLGNASTPAASATIAGVPSGWPAGLSATVDTYGNVTVTFASAPPANSGYVQVTLSFNSTLSTNTAAWTSATALNSTVPLTVLGNNTVLCGMTFTGTVTAGTVLFEVSADNVIWFAISGTLPAIFGTSSAWAAAASGNQTLQFNVAGYAFFRARLSVVITGTGTVNVAALTSNLPTSAPVTIGQPTASQLNAVVSGTYNTSAPAPANTAAVSVQSDGAGNIFVNPYRRSQVVTATGNIASVTPANIIAAQGAGIFADLAALVLTCRIGATAAVLFGVLISDGTKSYRFNLSSELAATGGGNPPLTINFEPPLVATTANVAWTIALTSVTDSPSVDYVTTFIQQKAS